MMPHHAVSQPDGHAASLAEQVHEELAAILDYLVHDITPDADLRANYGVGEYERNRIALDQRFGVFVPLPILSGWKTVGEITRYVESRLAAERITG